jgi:hypothetical protein
MLINKMIYHIWHVYFLALLNRFIINVFIGFVFDFFLLMARFYLWSPKTNEVKFQCSELFCTEYNKALMRETRITQNGTETYIKGNHEQNKYFLYLMINMACSKIIESCLWSLGFVKSDLKFPPNNSCGTC